MGAKERRDALDCWRMGAFSYVALIFLVFALLYLFGSLAAGFASRLDVWTYDPQFGIPQPGAYDYSQVYRYALESFREGKVCDSDSVHPTEPDVPLPKVEPKPEPIPEPERLIGEWVEVSGELLGIVRNTSFLGYKVSLCNVRLTLTNVGSVPLERLSVDVAIYDGDMFPEYMGFESIPLNGRKFVCQDVNLGVGKSAVVEFSNVYVDVRYGEPPYNEHPIWLGFEDSIAEPQYFLLAGTLNAGNQISDGFGLRCYDGETFDKIVVELTVRGEK